MSSDLGAPRPGDPFPALRGAWPRLRRAVLRRRRPVVAVLVGVAVLAGLSALRPAPPAASTVAVAAHDLLAGQVLTADDLTTAALPDDAVPHGTEPASALVGRALAGAVRAGEPLTDVRLVGGGLAAPGRVAVPVRLPDAAEAALLAVGDHVDLLAADPQGGASGAVALASDVPVLATPLPDDDGAASSLPGRIVVVGLDPGEVGTVAQAATTAVVSFTWHPAVSTSDPANH